MARMRALRTHTRGGAVVKKGDVFDATDAELDGIYGRETNPLAEKVGARTPITETEEEEPETDEEDVEDEEVAEPKRATKRAAKRATKTAKRRR